MATKFTEYGHKVRLASQVLHISGILPVILGRIDSLCQAMDGWGLIIPSHPSRKHRLPLQDLLPEKIFHIPKMFQLIQRFIYLPSTDQ
jgi:hypothetical protein